MDAVQVSSEQPTISVLRGNDTDGHACVAVILANGFVRTSEHDLYPGIALSPEAAQQVIAKIQAVLREISGPVNGFFKLKPEVPKKA
jgi:hypothetical protein